MKLARQIIPIVIAVLAALIVGLFVFYAWGHWWSVDDAADIKGNWQVEGTETTFTVSDTEMRIADDVIYKYEINTADKTLTFDLGTMSGKAHYVFSAKRTQLVIIDINVDFFSSLAVDLGDRIQSIVSGNYSDLNAGFLNSSIDSSMIVRLNKLD